MKKVYYLQTCDTCKRILKSVDTTMFEQHEIKSNPITPAQLEELYQFTNSYEALFNKRAKLYREKNLKDKQLTEADYKRYILEEYTFLKRPVFVVEDKIFIGNSKKTVEALIEFLKR